MPSRPKFSAVAAPVERPLPLWILYPLFFVLIYLSHFTLLRLPFFWDEAGYYIPAALDFFRTGSLIPHSTLTNAHPPLPSILLAAGGTSPATSSPAPAPSSAWSPPPRCSASSASPACLPARPSPRIVTLLTALYPVWFAQSTLAHADLFAAAFTLWALSFYFAHRATPNRSNAAAILFSLAALSKETAIVTPVALALWELTLLLTEPHAATQPSLHRPSFMPILPLALWYAYHRHVTGFVFGNPEFLRYNATANLSPIRVLLSLWHRVVHLTVHMNLYVPVALHRSLPAVHEVCPLAETSAIRLNPLLTVPRRHRSATPSPFPSSAEPSSPATSSRSTRSFFSSASPSGSSDCRRTGPRPRRPYRRRLPRRPLHQPALPLRAGGQPHLPRLHRPPPAGHRASSTAQYPSATVLTAWPATTELEHPDLGYIRHPIQPSPSTTSPLAEIRKAATDPGAYDTALIFSTKWVPPGGLNLAQPTAATDTRYFDFHRDLSPRRSRRRSTATSSGSAPATASGPPSSAFPAPTKPCSHALAPYRPDLSSGSEHARPSTQPL